MLHSVRYGGRPVMHRLSLVEMAVPYADPRYVPCRTVWQPATVRHASYLRPGAAHAHMVPPGLSGTSGMRVP